MQFKYQVEFTIERVSGKFASRDQIQQVLMEALEEIDIDLSGLGADGESEYEVTDSSVTEL